MTQNFFITATGTNIGKTLLTATLAHQLRQDGGRVRALKPVISGFDPHHVAESDTGQLLQAQELPCDMEHAAMLSPWRFAAPLAPNMAAEREGAPIAFSALVEFCQTQAKSAAQAHEVLLVEGVGGVFVPLDHRHTVLDWMQALNWPVILVTGSYLGTLSHSFTALHVLKHHGLKVQAVVVSESNDNPVPVSETVENLMQFAPLMAPIHVMPRLPGGTALWQNMPSLTAIVKGTAQ